MPPSRRPQAWRLALTLAVTLVLVAVLVRRFGGTGEVVDAARRARPAWVALGFAAVAACTLVTALRWKLVLGGMGRSLAFGRALAVVLATSPLAAVTPSRTNDLLRPLAVRDRVPLAVGTGSIVAEKAVNLVVLLALAACGAAFEGLWGWAAAIAGMLAVATAGIALVVTRRAWLERLPLLRRRPDRVEQLFEALVALRRSPLHLAGIAASSLTIRVLTVAITHALLVAVGSDVRWFETLALWPTAILVGLVPVTLGGVGTRDATFLVLLASHGTHVDPSSVLAATMGYWALAIGAPAVVGIPFMIRETLAVRRR